MENLIVCITLYILIVAVAYRPHPTTTNPAAPIEYFPEIEVPVKPAIAKPVPHPIKTIVEPMPHPSFKVPNVPVKNAPIAVAPDLNNLSIRQLKKMASAAKIKRYSTLTKAELIQALA